MPSVQKGNGTGHLKRCIEWSRSLPVQNFFCPDGDLYFSDEKIIDLLKICKSPVLYRSNLNNDWDLIILDNRNTKPGYIPADMEHIPVIAIDESGEYRNTAPYIIDILPGLHKMLPNQQGLSFFQLPEKRKETKLESEFLDILVSFGGEDPGKLTETLLIALGDRTFPHTRWTLVEGPFFTTPLASSSNSDVRMLKSPENLKNLLRHYDLVITSYGITAFEAVASNTPVILINPSQYHDKLSHNAFIPYIPKGWKKKGTVLINQLLKVVRTEHFADQNTVIQKKYDFSEKPFKNWLEEISPVENKCPLCGSRNNPCLYRYNHKSYFTCSRKDCGIIYLVNFSRKTDLYKSSYFFDDYKKQYGKTYLQDFEHIKQSGIKRIRRILKQKESIHSILDVGCAFGPFLEAAKEEGLNAFGIDVTHEGIAYIIEHLENVSADNVSLQDFDPLKSFGRKRFDAITLWYVIEHFQVTGPVLDKISSLLEPGGVFAFSTPNGKGVTGRLNRDKFYKESPDDHFTVWDRKSAKKILKKYGYHNIRFHITGYHPERIPWKLPIRKIFNRTVLLWICKIFKLGDTFEIYCRRKG